MENLQESLSQSINNVAGMANADTRRVRKALRAILREEYPGVTRCSDADVLAAAREFDGAFAARHVAEKAGCSRQRVIRVVREAGARDVVKGVYEFPRG